MTKKSTRPKRIRRRICNLYLGGMSIRNVAIKVKVPYPDAWLVLQEEDVAVRQSRLRAEFSPEWFASQNKRFVKEMQKHYPQYETHT